ncbi:sugar phosphate isomerase/epimerase family protein [Streptomyces uncialis]|uniref:Xylose isomerase n=1 Tax=Streptomyces uncialis TaxID=1048205 RepID=A0A1Q4UZX2_9ACTN|nr:sugar phosphate isomerase/epimerase family protein [Streptomyces uncialis]MCX4663954.1 sugar phosphate isomerase/epimerase [Streptomyces uncialis]OKH91114.1 xylose isomerase [Streptomyces uncialis]
MKLAFSTLGVPGLPLPQVIALATANGYHGVELRAHPEEPVHLDMTKRRRAEVVREFADGGVEIVGLAGYAQVAAPGTDGPVLDELRRLLELAGELGAPFVRVFPGAGPEQRGEEADATAARRLAAAAEQAATLGVRILLETHDSHRAGVAAARVVARVGRPEVGVLWDVLHTWLAGEAPTVTHAALAPHLGYVQVKDVASAADTTPLALGAGVLPLAGCLDTLSRAGWDGWLCWEYEKRWYEEAAPLPGLLGEGRTYLEELSEESLDAAG